MIAVAVEDVVAVAGVFLGDLLEDGPELGGGLVEGADLDGVPERERDRLGGQREDAREGARVPSEGDLDAVEQLHPRVPHADAQMEAPVVLGPHIVHVHIHRPHGLIGAFIVLKRFSKRTQRTKH